VKVLKVVFIPDSVTEIGDNAFSDCDNLKVVSVPHNLTNIGKNAFGNAEVVAR